MADELGRPQTRPGDDIVIQYQSPRRYQRGSVPRIRYTSISNFRNYVELELYLLENCGGGHRIYPGGADYPVITYTKYNDNYNEEDCERELGTEEWEEFAATVLHILIKRVQA